ncbi:MAG: hypothetical protein HY553_11320, partial [Elusimicrobia bacterium]|nr:hypothetical protein [Elusimicrobiota bacterium]
DRPTPDPDRGDGGRDRGDGGRRDDGGRDRGDGGRRDDGANGGRGDNDRAVPRRPRPGDDGQWHERPGSGIDRHRGRVDTAGYWHVYRDRWGRIEEEYGPWEREVSQRDVRRGGAETGLGQSAFYSTALDSRAYRERYVLYWRWLGYDCDPRDSSRCARWVRQWRWFLEDVYHGPAEFMTVELRFNGDQPLLPWERERFSLRFDGARVWLDLEDAAFRYAVSGPVVDYGRGVATIELTPGSRILRSAEAGKVNARLESEGKLLRLLVDDARAVWYAGETLELRWTVMKVERPSWRNPFGKDKKIAQRDETQPVRLVVDATRPQTAVDLIPVDGGEYYVKWGFRRAASRLSSGEWHGRPDTNKVQR